MSEWDDFRGASGPIDPHDGAALQLVASERIAELEKALALAQEIARSADRLMREEPDALREKLAEASRRVQDLSEDRDTLRGLLREGPAILTRCRRFMSVDNDATTTDQEEYQRALADSLKWRERITAALPKEVEG